MPPIAFGSQVPLPHGCRQPSVFGAIWPPAGTYGRLYTTSLTYELAACMYLPIYASTVAPRNTNSLHATRKLLHRGMKIIFVKVTIVLSGQPDQKRFVALLLLLETLGARQPCLAPLLSASFRPNMIKFYQYYS
jgi:hypothetical protein